jgi:hypothetical protein
MWGRGLIALMLAGAAGALFGACSTDAVGVESCRQIETARCHNAAACGISLTNPPHRGGPTTDVEFCIQFYNVACLHGLEAPGDPGAPAVQACVNAINASCDAVRAPETDPACQWLIPPAPPPADAATDTDSEAGDAGDADATETGP